MDSTLKFEGKKEVPAKEILIKIEKGMPVEYEGISINGDLDFSSLDLAEDSTGNRIILSRLDIRNSEINGRFDSSNTIFKESVEFRNTIFHNYAYFDDDIFEDDAIFEFVDFRLGCRFYRTTFKEMASFDSSQFRKRADFRGVSLKKVTIDGKEINWVDEARKMLHKLYFVNSSFEEGIYLSNALIEVETYFNKAKLRGDSRLEDSSFDLIDFEEAEIQSIMLDNSNIKHPSFHKTKFGNPFDQLRVSRIAKSFFEEYSDKDVADYYYYKEMEAKRILNGLPISQEWMENVDYSPIAAENFATNKKELFIGLKDALVSIDVHRINRFIKYNLFEYVFIQSIFSYGINPFKLFAWWFFFVGIFAAIYWIGDGVNGAIEPLDYVWFSISVAVTPGFAGYQLTPGLFQWLAIMEAIFGTFMWAAFIATFSRKYMR